MAEHYGDVGKSDEQLLAMHAMDSTNRYLGELYERYIPMVYGLCLKYLRNVDDAADAVMDIFEELVQKVGRYDITVFRTWLYSVARNHCLQKLRRKGREVPADDAGRIMEYAPLVHLLCEGDDDAELVRRLEECLGKLPEKQHECMVKFFYEDKSYADIVAETLYPLKSVKSFLQNGRRNLKICMERGDETD